MAQFGSHYPLTALDWPLLYHSSRRSFGSWRSWGSWNYDDDNATGDDNGAAAEHGAAADDDDGGDDGGGDDDGGDDGGDDGDDDDNDDDDDDDDDHEDEDEEDEDDEDDDDDDGGDDDDDDHDLMFWWLDDFMIFPTMSKLPCGDKLRGIRDIPHLQTHRSVPKNIDRDDKSGGRAPPKCQMTCPSVGWRDNWQDLAPYPYMDPLF